MFMGLLKSPEQFEKTASAIYLLHSLPAVLVRQASA